MGSAVSQTKPYDYGLCRLVCRLCGLKSEIDEILLEAAGRAILVA